MNNGFTNLDNWNTSPDGDLGDWAQSAGADALLAFSPSGQINQFTAADVELMNVLGWDVSGTDQYTLIHANGPTSLSLAAGQYYYLFSGASGSFLKFGGGAVVAGQFGAWTPFNAVQTTSGYDIAWTNGAGQYTVWTTDSSGNFTSNLIPVVAGTSTALELLEFTFGQDLNGDGGVGTTKAVIQTDLGTQLTLVGVRNYFLLDATSGCGPWLKLGGTDVVAGQFGAWAPIGAVQVGGVYEVAWKNPGANQYNVWITDSSGNFLSQTGLLSGTDYTLESLETAFQQDLNGDNTIGLTKTLIQNDGSTDLTAVANHFFLYDHTSGAGPSLKLGGMDVIAGQFGAWTPFDAVQTASGYDVAWKNGAGQYIVWSTDSDGNFTSNLTPVVPGASIALETLEYTFNQDLNGDGTTGVTQQLIQTDLGTSLTLIGSQSYSLLRSGSGPSLKLGGTDVMVGQFGAWSPIGAVRTASGYDVAWKNPGANQYNVWITDNSGNFLSQTGVLSGTDYTLESLESTFQQDLNGDNTTGLTKTLIQNDGSTDLTAVANRFFLYDHTSGMGPSLKLGGMDVVAGQFGAWSPFGAVQTASGYDVAWKNGAGQYIVWSTDSNGNFTSNLTPVVPGTSTALEGLEPTFNQDLNGDHFIGIPNSANPALFTSEGAGATVVVTNMTFTLVSSATAIDLTNVTSESASSTLGGGTPNLALLAQYSATSVVGASNVHDGAVAPAPPPNSPPLLTSPHA